MSDINDTQAAISAGMALGEVRHVGATPFILAPADTKHIDLSGMLSKPARHKSVTTLYDAQSFVAIVNQFKGENTRIYTRLVDNTTAPAFVAVFNDGSRTEAEWRDHRAIYSAPLAIEWRTWNASSGKAMTQADFSAFVEANLPDIVHPAAADMLEIARSLEAKKKVNFASGIRLSNGQNELTYEEEVSGTAAKGRLSVPEEFIIGIPVLEGGPRYEVTARLRYRIAEGGKLTMWFELVRPHKIIKDASDEVMALVKAETGLAVLNGSI